MRSVCTPCARLGPGAHVSLTQAEGREHRACRLRSPLGYSPRTLDDTLSRAHGLRESESGDSAEGRRPARQGRAGRAGRLGGPPAGVTAGLAAAPGDPCAGPTPRSSRRPRAFRSSDETQPTVTLHEHSVLSARWPPTLSASRSGSAPAPLTRRTERDLPLSPSWPGAVPCETVAEPREQDLRALSSVPNSSSGCAPLPVEDRGEMCAQPPARAREA